MSFDPKEGIGFGYSQESGKLFKPSLSIPQDVPFYMDKKKYNKVYFKNYRNWYV